MLGIQQNFINFGPPSSHKFQLIRMQNCVFNIVLGLILITHGGKGHWPAVVKHGPIRTSEDVLSQKHWSLRTSSFNVKLRLHSQKDF